MQENDVGYNKRSVNEDMLIYSESESEWEDSDSNRSCDTEFEESYNNVSGKMMVLRCLM